ncbi:MAG TPA: hypothetical protein VKX46_00010, partial [Ktedonobacteraceae bacterium]|nr:hypothetical protein [Ktedonobacteraceae bacterium]
GTHLFYLVVGTALCPARASQQSTTQVPTFSILWCGTGAMGLCHTTIYIPGAAPPRDIPEKL